MRLFELSVLRLRGAVATMLRESKEYISIAHSGGKDSVAITHLVDQAWPGSNLPLVHTPKPGVTHPSTERFLYSLGSKRKLLLCPADQHRTLGYTVQIDGTRIAEHNRTDGRSTDVIIDGVARPRTELTLIVKNGVLGMTCVYPIFDWTDEEVWEYIKLNQLPVSPEYGS